MISCEVGQTQGVGEDRQTNDMVSQDKGNFNSEKLKRSFENIVSSVVVQNE